MWLSRVPCIRNLEKSTFVFRMDRYKDQNSYCVTAQLGGGYKTLLDFGCVRVWMCVYKASDFSLQSIKG